MRHEYENEIPVVTNDGSHSISVTNTQAIIIHVGLHSEINQWQC